ncbi:hypothetical protein V495_07750 [Pseudogymnoascus sp. VKM F-4514 (FW-929)]|nr:hypothetical protein V495_07750 [Pseudogymnoascus sp. VKM F-4514 (FW-929)]KFY54623.1 hypothetical protein V497_07551 [Pseudogymnoascus sp. VKM F-4516 (FW-969)]
MASPNHQWLQLPNVNQWGEAAFDSSYSSKAGSLAEFPFDESLFASNTPSSFNTTPPTPNNPSTQNYNSQHSSRRQPQSAKAPRSESSSAGSTAHDTSHDTSYGHISQRRKSQNRASQRAFRQRRTERFKELQSRVVGLEKQLDAAKVVNRLLAQMSGLRSFEELKGRVRASQGMMGDPGALGPWGNGRGVDSEGVDGAREPPACEEGAGFQTCDLPLVGPDFWDAPVLGEGFEADLGDWQAAAMGDGSLSSPPPFGIQDGHQWA